ncbi:sporulation integral membrane protein YtvI [Salsuginibacillus kocurii]|uniref:sporulation integral membrane protein YtvI n=1 Tax=Salsuginibacillus kocurii TaxID=427078 RepID=UPI00036F344C|nr:sporulation integral membrane protein YtvI [Salsuginibacillus kocurii]
MAQLLTKKNLLTALFILFLLVAAYFILPVSLPILLALLTALLLNPLVRFLTTRAKLKRNLAVTFVFTLFLCILGLTGYIGTTQLITQIVDFVDNLPALLNEINRAWLNFQANLETTYADLPPDLVNEINSQVTSTLNSIREDFSPGEIIASVTAMIAAIPSYLVSFLVYLIALFLFMLELPRLTKQMYSFMTEATAKKVSFMTSRLASVLLGFFKAQFLVSIIIFIVTYIGLSFIAPDVALMMSVIIWLVDFIPIIGSIAILGPWALFQLILGDLVLGSQLLVLAAVLLIIRRTVEPKVMGHHIGLSPLATLISLYIGLMLLGVVGFIVGPLLVIAFTSAREAGIIKFNFKI